MCSIWPSPKIHNLLGNGHLWQVTRTIVDFLYFDCVWYVQFLIIFQQLMQHGDVATVPDAGRSRASMTQNLALVNSYSLVDSN